MGKTVTTYLIDRNTNGTQYSFISNKICQMFVIFYTKGRGCDAKGFYNSSSFTVLEGGAIVNYSVPSF